MAALSASPGEDDGLPFPELAKPQAVCELDERIPSYEFLEFIDRGGMGAVYKARQRSLDRIVAVKVLPQALHHRPAFTERFAREARALALLNHPHIVSVYDFGEVPGGGLFYVMEYVKGTNLRHLMKHGRAEPRQLLNIAMQVCEALQFAHLHGVVHRDVKPANVLLDERGHVKVADFGLAKVIGPSTSAGLTGASDALGTPDYMAPEAATREHEVDHRADIYSLGVLLYEMLTGHVPKGMWEPPSRAAGTDVRLDEVISRALQPDPVKRFQSVGELSQVMKQLVQATGGVTPITSVAALSRMPPSSSPDALTVPMRGPRRRRRLPRAAVGALLVGLIGAAAFPLVKDQPWFREALGRPAAEESPAVSMLTEQERQRALARTVFAYGGFINITTAFRADKLMGGEHDVRSEDALPVGAFTIWRVSLAENPRFNDEDLAGLARACELADSVSNVNLFGTAVTPAGLSHITRLSGTLVSLQLRNTRAFSAESMPFIASCRNLRTLLLSSTLAAPSSTALATEIELVRELREQLPECDILLE